MARLDDFCPTRLKVEPRDKVRTTGLSAGIRTGGKAAHASEIWRLTFERLTRTEFRAIRDSFREVGYTEAFGWTPPDSADELTMLYKDFRWLTRSAGDLILEIALYRFPGRAAEPEDPPERNAFVQLIDCATIDATATGETPIFTADRAWFIDSLSIRVVSLDTLSTLPVLRAGTAGDPDELMKAATPTSIAAENQTWEWDIIGRSRHIQTGEQVTAGVVTPATATALSLEVCVYGFSI